MGFVHPTGPADVPITRYVINFSFSSYNVFFPKCSSLRFRVSNMHGQFQTLKTLVGVIYIRKYPLWSDWYISWASWMYKTHMGVMKLAVKKERSIIARFNWHNDHERVRKAASEKLKNKPAFSVYQQYPREIYNRRKLLIPKLKELQRQKRKAKLVYDKLYVDGRPYEFTHHQGPPF
jgi:hypothetical protein